MELLENSLQVVGIAICVLALLPLAFWAAQSWSLLRHNQRQFRNSQELLRQQILAASDLRVTKKQRDLSTESVANFESSDRQLQENSIDEPSDCLDKTPINQIDMVSDSQVQADGTWLGFRQFRVEQLVKETASCTSVYLAPIDGEPIARFQAGQHLPLRFSIPGQPKPVIRCYSLSGGPGKSRYRISVKAMPAHQSDHVPGLVSNFVNDQLKEGDIIESKAPSGSFVLDLDDSRPVILLAGGIGITPMISMIESIQAHSPDRLTILLYGVHNKTEHAFADYLGQIKKASDHFHVLNCYSNPQPDDVQGKDFHVKGFVSIELIKRLMPNPDCQFYLCGPPAFMNSLSESLEAWGVPASQVYSEAFGPASINKPQPIDSIPVAAGAIEVMFGKTGKAVVWSPECESLLELAESHGVDIEFGCRAGSCGTCSTELLAGEVQYPEGIQAACEPSECLPCVARPVGSLKLGA